MQLMTTRSRLIPFLVAALVTQSLIGAVPHTHRFNESDTEVSQAETGVITLHDVGEPAHECLACSVHVPMVDSAAGRGIIHGVEQTSSESVLLWSISILSVNRKANPRGPPRIT